MYMKRNNLLLIRNVPKLLIGCVACNLFPALQPPEVREGVVSIRRPADGIFFMLSKGFIVFYLGGSGGTRRGRRVGDSVGKEKKENLEFDVC